MPSFLGLDKPIVAMVHFPPLPGSPLYDRDGGMAAIVERNHQCLHGITCPDVAQCRCGGEANINILIAA